jgi:Flp pilus assembly protein TadD
LLLGRSTQDLARELKENVQQTLSNMLGTLNQIHETSSSQKTDNPTWHLELAKGLMATGRWREAASHFEKYVQYDSLNWEIQFSRAISYANSRGGRSTDLSAIRAINEAIILSGEDKDLDNDLRARMFSYRAAAWKRLGRLEEAEADLEVAAKFAERDYEMLDIKYNRACIYAMRGHRQQLIDTVRSMQGHKGYAALYSGMRSHLHDYFAEFADDTEFLTLIGAA